MPADLSPQTVLEEIANHARGDDLARLVHTVAFAAADEKRPRLEEGLAEIAERLGVTKKDADTPHGNVLIALEKSGAEAPGAAPRSLLAGLLARGVALSPPSGADAEARVAEALVWLATYTAIDALHALDDALHESESGLWIAIARVIRKADAGDAPLIGRAGALIGAAALRESHTEAAQAEAKTLAKEARDPVLRALLASPPEEGQSEAPSAAVVEGELVSPPKGLPLLLLLGVTGILAVMHAGRLFAKVALRYRRPAELRVTPRGLTVLASVELLGRTLRTRETHVPIEALLRASREVTYPRIAMYVGLIGLAVGSYFGVSLLVDGARAGSPELLGIGLLVVAAGVTLDFVLESILPTTKGRCRVVIVPRRGAALSVGAVEPARADAALKTLLRTPNS